MFYKYELKVCKKHVCGLEISFAEVSGQKTPTKKNANKL